MTDQARLRLTMRRLAVGDRSGEDQMILNYEVTEMIMRKLGSKRCDLWEFLVQCCGYKNQQIWNHLCQECPPTEDRLIPSLIEVWSMLITTALMRTGDERCECYQRYQGSRKHIDMQKSCQRNHWIESFAKKLLEAPDADAARWLKTAVDGNSNLKFRVRGMFMAFANSMLCAVFTTPAETHLVLVRIDGKDVLVDERTLVQQHAGAAEEEQIIDRQSEDVHHVWVCHHCRHVVGKDGKVCRSESCVWELKSVPVIDAVQVEAPFDAYISTCGDGHYWPRRGLERCPVEDCGLPPKMRKKVAITFVDVPYESI